MAAVRDAQALPTRESEIELACDASLEQVEVLGQADARHDHMQLVDPIRIAVRQRTGQEVGLLLIVTFEYDTISTNDQLLQRLDDALAAQYRAIAQMGNGSKPPLFFAAPRIPAPDGWGL
jgi:hypothetical protein